MDDVTRRGFLRRSAAGGAGAIIAARQASLAAALNGRAAEDGRTGAQASSPTEPADGFALEEATIADLQREMEAGRASARFLVDRYIARIEALDRTGPALRHVLEINPEARDIADALDAERRARGPRGPLHGIPILLKDNIGTADRMTTTAGSLALE